MFHLTVGKIRRVVPEGRTGGPDRARVRLRLLTEETNIDKLVFVGVEYKDGEVRLLLDTVEDEAGG